MFSLEHFLPKYLYNAMINNDQLLPCMNIITSGNLSGQSIHKVLNASIEEEAAACHDSTPYTRQSLSDAFRLSRMPYTTLILLRIPSQNLSNYLCTTCVLIALTIGVHGSADCWAFLAVWSGTSLSFILETF